MIDWNDPDYVAAGHFYALLKQVTIKCADPQQPGEDITSYVYGSNVTADMPGIAFSNDSTLVDGAFGMHTEGAAVHSALAFGVLAVALMVQFF